VAAICLTLAAQASFAQTVYVGTCKPHQITYSTISSAVAAVAPNTTVAVCPGTYPEMVTITTPLTLKGLTAEQGVRTVYVQSFTVQDAAPVNISNVVVNGNGGTGGGIQYAGAAGTVENVDIRVGGIFATGYGPDLGSDLTVQNSSISGGGVNASGPVGGETLLNLISNWITSGGGAAVQYNASAAGLIQGNTILASGGTALDIGSFFGSPIVNANTITGADVAISFGTSEGQVPVVTNNHLYNNGIGILSGQRGSGPTINSNTIVQSSVAAISFAICNNGSDNIYKHNTIVNAPVGIANISTSDVSSGNQFYDVTTPTTPCP
jgi:hypothetical protein